VSFINYHLVASLKTANYGIASHMRSFVLDLQDPDMKRNQELRANFEDIILPKIEKQLKVIDKSFTAMLDAHPLCGRFARPG
jgi:hypothetical protein